MLVDITLNVTRHPGASAHCVGTVSPIGTDVIIVQNHRPRIKEQICLPKSHQPHRQPPPPPLTAFKPLLASLDLHKDKTYCILKNQQLGDVQVQLGGPRLVQYYRHFQSVFCLKSWDPMTDTGGLAAWWRSKRPLFPLGKIDTVRDREREQIFIHRLLAFLWLSLANTTEYQIDILNTHQKKKKKKKDVPLI